MVMRGIKPERQHLLSKIIIYLFLQDRGQSRGKAPVSRLATPRIVTPARVQGVTACLHFDGSKHRSQHESY